MIHRILLKKWLSVCITGFIAVGAMSPALSHHSFAMYDMTQMETVTGKLIRFIPGANHAQLLFTLIDDKGAPVLDDSGEAIIWGVETGPAARISRQGVTVKSFPVGTVMTVTLHPLRDGRLFGALSSAGLVKCGDELPVNGCNELTGEIFLAR